MTTKTIFYCDICRDEIKEDDKEKCMGLYFISNNEFEKRYYNECQHHLCKHCIESLKKIFRKEEE